MRSICYAVSGVAALLLAASVQASLAAGTERVSVGSSGQQGDEGSRDPSISGNGRYVTFDSNARNLVSPPLSDPLQEVYRHDRDTGETVLVSVGFDGKPADNGALGAKISRGGRFVAFDSDGSNLVAGVSASGTQVYRRDLTAGKTALVSVSSSGEPANTTAFTLAMSADGRYVVFLSDATNLAAGAGGHYHVFVRDVVAGVTTVEDATPGGDPGNGDASHADITPDGRWLAFSSDAPDLVGDDTNGVGDVFLRDRRAKKTILVSVARGGGSGSDLSNQPVISDDGSLVAFTSFARNLVAGDTNGELDVFVRHVKAGTTERVSVSSAGGQGSGSSAVPSISADGRRVAFLSRAANLVADDTNGRDDVFVRDRTTGTTFRASLAYNGAQARNYSSYPEISADGRLVTFSSPAGNLVRHDTNNESDVFVRKLPAE
jgi:Tol biopolymer transport system component